MINKNISIKIFKNLENVTTILAHVEGIFSIVEDMISSIQDTSWMSNLTNENFKIQYLHRAKPTLEKIVQEILTPLFSEENKEAKITKEAGEYVISMTAQNVLCQEYKHNIIPIAELWKEKETGNPGFDFHSESTDALIFFGEAKYRSRGSGYRDAFSQLDSFLNKNKHLYEIGDLSNFVKNSYSASRITEDPTQIGLVAAFSINGKNLNAILTNAESKLKEHSLLEKSVRMALIGIKICS